MLMLIMLIAAVAGISAILLTDGSDVKELTEPVSCSACGRPTWSAGGVCAKCRVPAPPAPPVPPVMEETPAELVPIMPALDGEGRIAEDIHCRQCGYNLRGLSTAGVCPECEMTISRSIFGDMLRFSDPHWVKWLHQGMWLLIIAIFTMIGGSILGVIAIAVFTAALTGGGGGGAPMMVMGLFAALMTLITFIWVAAVWMITTPDPGRGDVERLLNARTLARWCIVASLASVPLGAIQPTGWAAGGPAAAPAVTTLFDILLDLTSALLGLVALVGTAAGVVYLKSLALRIPNDRLATHTKTAGWGYVIVGAMGQLVAIASLFILGPMGPAAMVGTAAYVLWMIGGCFFGLGALVFGIWMIVLLFRYAIAFGKAREGAERFAAAGIDATVNPQ